MQATPYSRAFMAEIIKDFQIPAEHIPKLESVLNQAARVCGGTKTYRVTPHLPSSTEQQLLDTRNDLERVDETYAAFAQALEALSRHAQDRLWDPAFADPVRRQVPNALAQLDPNNYPAEQAFRTTLNDFGKRLRERLDDFPEITPKVGRPRLAELHNWIALIARFWRDELKREFTYSHLARKGSTVDFCWRLLQRIDGDAKLPQLGTVMREVVTSISQEQAREASRTNSQKPPHL